MGFYFNGWTNDDLPIAANQILTTWARLDDVQNRIHYVLTVKWLAPKLVQELLGNLHRDWAVIQPSNRCLEVVVDKVLVSNRSKVLGTTRDGCRIEQVASLLVGAERNEELPNHSHSTTLIPLGLALCDISKCASSLSLNLVVILIGKLEIWFVVRVLMFALIRREPCVGAGLATTITRSTVHLERAGKVTRTLTAKAETHLATDGLENLVIAQLRRNLDDDRANLEPARRSMRVGNHLLGSRLKNSHITIRQNDLLAPENRRSILKDASRDVVEVGDADAPATFGNPQAGLRDSGVGTVVCGERHVCFGFCEGVF